MKTITMTAAIIEDESTGEFYWICACPECGGDPGDEVDLIARRAFGPFNSAHDADEDAKAFAEGRETESHRQWCRRYFARSMGRA